MAAESHLIVNQRNLSPEPSCFQRRNNARKPAAHHGNFSVEMHLFKVVFRTFVSSRIMVFLRIGSSYFFLDASDTRDSSYQTFNPVPCNRLVDESFVIKPYRHEPVKKFINQRIEIMIQRGPRVL